MKLFSDMDHAYDSLDKKKKYFTNSLCPFSDDVLCGNWCGLFYMDKVTPDGKCYVILGCKGIDKHLYVDEVIEDYKGEENAE